MIWPVTALPISLVNVNLQAPLHLMHYVLSAQWITDRATPPLMIEE
jgi:hypothetical protein